MLALGIILGLLPGFAWLFFYLQEDLHPEPKRLIALTFIVGAAAAVVAVLLEFFTNQNLLRIGIASLSPLGIVLFAFIEEIVKFFSVYLVVHKHPAFNEPVDAMVYMVVASLGFATLENLGVVNTSVSQAAFLTDIFQITSLRFIGATLLHTLTAGIIGYYWAISIREFGAKRFITLGILLATALHALFNYLILKVGPGNLIYVTALLLLIGFFVLNDFEKLKRRAI